MISDHCEFCGAEVIGGYEGCRSLFNEITAKLLSSAIHYAIQRAAVDCYALQHPEYFCVSAKSYAAHLSGLCVAIEYNGSIEVNSAIQKWLNGPIDLNKPSVLIARGELTVLHIRNSIDLNERAQHVNEWCASVWLAYNELHAEARSYVQAAVAAQRKSN